MILNMTYGGSSGASGGTLTVTAPAGVTVTAAKDGKSYTRTANAEGKAVFKGLSGGTWAVTISDGVRPPATVSAAIVTDYDVVIDFEMIPAFTYTGDYEVVSDNDEPITSSQGNWKIRFLTSGTLTFTDLRGAANGIDVFLVGAGGGTDGRNGGAVDSRGYGGSGGAGSGYTKTITLNAAVNTPYEIVIGAGVTASKGGSTSAFGETVEGGEKGQVYTVLNGSGGDGGSGGNAYGAGRIEGSLEPLPGAVDGNDGLNSINNERTGGKGQGTTTREFGEENGRLYASGGFGGEYDSTDTLVGPYNGADNTGDGADGTYNAMGNAAKGGSGIVIIRNARGAA